MTTSEIFPRVKLDDALIKRIKTFLGDDGDLFARLWAEYLHLRMCFNDLKNGFGGDAPPMIPVWAVATEFQNRYRNLLIEAIVLAACRLTDKTKKTVSIKALPRFFTDEPDLKMEIDQLVRTATTANETLRAWRNWQLAHTAKERERTGVSGDEAEAAVDAIHEALAFVWRRRFNEDPELPHPRPASAALGEHLSHMHERTAAFEAWLLEAAGHDDGDDIPGAAAAVRRLAGRPETEATNPRDEPDPVVEFLTGAREVRKMADRIARMRAAGPPTHRARPL